MSGPGATLAHMTSYELPYRSKSRNPSTPSGKWANRVDALSFKVMFVLLLWTVWFLIGILLDCTVLALVWAAASALGHPLSHPARVGAQHGLATCVVVGFWLWVLWDGRSSRREARVTGVQVPWAPSPLRSDGPVSAAQPVPPAPVEPLPTAVVAKAAPAPVLPEPSSGNSSLEGCIRWLPPTPAPPTPPMPAKPVATRPAPQAQEPTFDDEEHFDPEPLPPGLSELAWHVTPDVNALLAHALPRIPFRHFCLVLSQLAEWAWPHWHRLRPDAWEPALSLAAVRGWALGELDAPVLARARNALSEAASRERHRNSKERGMTWSTLKMLNFLVALAACAPPDWDPRLAEEVVGWLHQVAHALNPELLAWTIADEWASRSPWEVTRAYGYGLEAADRIAAAAEVQLSALLADEVRRWIPYPWRRSTGWRRRGNTVTAGDACLTLDGFRILRASAVSAPPRDRQRWWQ